MRPLQGAGDNASSCRAKQLGCKRGMTHLRRWWLGTRVSMMLRRKRLSMRSRNRLPSGWSCGVPTQNKRSARRRGVRLGGKEMVVVVVVGGYKRPTPGQS